MGKRNNNFKYRYLILFVVLALFLISGCSKKAEYVTITFDSNGGSLIESQQVKKGSGIIKPSNPIYQRGYTLDGWYVDDKKWNFETNIVVEDTTLIAKYIFDVKYEIDENNQVIITGVNKKEGEITILNEYDCKPTVAISHRAFYKCTSLTSIIIPDGVTSIGSEAFAYCQSLTNITIPNSVTSIGSQAFVNCTSLTKVNINNIESWCNISFNDYYSNPLGFGHNLYLNNKLITNLVIPNSVTDIGKIAFCDCHSLTSITIPDSVTSIGAYAFENCNSLTIYCEASSKPSGWASDWNPSNRPVVWGCYK